jgi:hypothetical protein
MNKNPSRPNAPLRRTFMTYQVNVPLRLGNMRSMIVDGKSMNTDLILGTSRTAQQSVDKFFSSQDHDNQLENDRKAYELKNAF